MSKRQNLAISCSFIAAAVLIVVYGAGFSWRNVIGAGVAFICWSIGDSFWKAACKARPFSRLQFSIGLTHIELALRDAGLYGEELPAAATLISGGMTGRGRITFTWLEPELFYVNTTNHY